MVHNSGIRTLSSQRYAAFLLAPTFKEASAELQHAELSGRGWSGIVAPAATPKAIIDKLSQEFMKARATPELVGRMRELGNEPHINTPAQFGKLMRTDIANYPQAINAANIRTE